MKLAIPFCCILSFIFVNACAQKPGDDYVFSSDFFSIKAYNPGTNAPDPDPTILLVRRGQIFRISIQASTTDKKSGFYLTFWPFRKDGTQIQPGNKPVEENAINKEPQTQYIDSANSTNKVFS